MKFIPLFGYPIADIPMEKVLKKIDSWLEEKKFHYLVTLNPEILVKARKNKDIRQFIKQADLCVADGTGLIHASRIINKQSPEKITGSDLTIELLKQQKYSFFLVGSKETTVIKAVNKIKGQYPGSKIAGYSHGYLNSDTELKVLSEIIRANPQIILVGMGFPKQEFFIKKLQNIQAAGVAIGVGGMIEILSGEKTRAPKWTQHIGIEWLYRGFKDPSRVVRWAFIPVFIALVLRIVFSQLLKNKDS